MKIHIEIPDNILVKLVSLELSKPKITNVFRHYLESVMQDGYGNFEINFKMWLEDLTEEEFLDIQKGNKL